MEILIYTADNQSLFARITAILESLQLNVLSATINTSDTGVALDTFHVLELNGDLISEPRRVDEIYRTLESALTNSGKLPKISHQRISRRLKHFDIDTQIDFEVVSKREGMAGLTEVRITAADRPGILSDIGRCFTEANIDVHDARISTLGERIDDVFLVTSIDATPLNNEQRVHLSDMLCERL